MRACVKVTEQLNVKLAGFKEKITQVTQAIENKMTTGWFLYKNGIDLWGPLDLKVNSPSASTD